MSRLPFLLMDLAQEVAALGGSPAPEHIELRLDPISLDAVAGALASHYGMPRSNVGPLNVHGVMIRSVDDGKPSRSRSSTADESLSGAQGAVEGS